MIGAKKFLSILWSSGISLAGRRSDGEVVGGLQVDTVPGCIEMREAAHATGKMIFSRGIIYCPHLSKETPAIRIGSVD